MTRFTIAGDIWLCEWRVCYDAAAWAIRRPVAQGKWDPYYACDNHVKIMTERITWLTTKDDQRRTPMVQQLFPQHPI